MSIVPPLPPHVSSPLTGHSSEERTVGASAAYIQAEEFLLSLVNYEKQPPPMTSDEGGWHLREFGRMLAAMGHPERAYPILHVAGTKGKGSTTRFLSTLLMAQGYKRVGSFISPHIEWFRERIAIDNEPIAESAFVDALDEVRRILAPQETEGFRTTFEVLTAMAFEVFRRERCEAVVLEPGMGGRLDCTNVATSRVALLTSIGFDHQKVLGKTLRQIASEKAGIIKPGTGAAVVGPQQLGRMRVVGRVAREQAASVGVPLELYSARRDPIRRIQATPHGFELDIAPTYSHSVLSTRNSALSSPHSALSAANSQTQHSALFSMLGRHQLDNLRAALMALEAFLRLEGRAVDPEGVRRGIENCRVPGRLEVVRDEPPVLLDGAHCPLSARAAGLACQEHFPGRDVILVLGVMADKKVKAILSNFARFGRVAEVFTYTVPSPRACPGGKLARLARRHFKKVNACETVEEAMEQALAAQKRQPRALVLCTGTFYGIARARRCCCLSADYAD
jgi:dihydrofolate synthase / folylpolyglutamate synthase